MDASVIRRLIKKGESKNLEFDQADFGMNNLQTFASQIAALSGKVPMESLIDKITDQPRNLLGIELPVIKTGQQANLTLFDPKKSWTLDVKTNKSKSKSSPWFGKKVTGKAVAVFGNGKHYLDS